MIKYRIVFSDTALTEMKNLYSQILQLSSSTYTAPNYVEAMRYEINKLMYFPEARPYYKFKLKDKECIRFIAFRRQLVILFTVDNKTRSVNIHTIQGARLCNNNRH